MSVSSNKHKVTVEALLQLKKNERPKAEFWESFERDFDRRRLHALVERSSWRDMLISPAFKALALGMPAVALVALTLVWYPAGNIAPSPMVINDASSPLDEPVLSEVVAAQKSLPVPVEIPVEIPVDTSRASNQFVVDAIHDNSRAGLHFRKVLYTPAIRLSVPSGAFYVRDSFSDSNYKVTTADVKLGSNF